MKVRWSFKYIPKLMFWWDFNEVRQIRRLVGARRWLGGGHLDVCVVLGEGLGPWCDGVGRLEIRE